MGTSQQLTPDCVAGQLFAHWLSAVHLATHCFAGGSGSGSGSGAGSAWGVGSGSSIAPGGGMSSTEPPHAATMAPTDNPIVTKWAWRTLVFRL